MTRAQDVTWTRQFGSAMGDTVTALAADTMGNLYVTGYTEGSLTGGAAPLCYQVFVRKYDAAGNALWTQYHDTVACDQSSGIALDGAGSVYVSGGEYGGAFVDKYDVNGTFIWTRHTDRAPFVGVTTDTGGNIYLAGGPDPAHPSMYFEKFDAGGNVVFFRELPADLVPQPKGVAFGGSGVYVVGWTDGVLPGEPTTSAGGTDAWIMKFNTNGAQLWQRQFGTAATDRATAVSVDSAGNAYVAGNTAGAFPGFTFLGGISDAFVRKYDPNGTALWTREFGSGTDDFAAAVPVDEANNVYVIGRTNLAIEDAPALGGLDAFVRKYDSGGSVVWTRLVGGPGSEETLAGTTDKNGSVYVGGYEYDALPGFTSAGAQDAWIAKLAASSSAATPTLNGSVTLQGLTPGTAAYQVALDVRLFQPGTATQVGTYSATADANGSFSLTGLPSGTYDVEVKEPHRIGRIARSLTLGDGVTTRAFGDLLAGDTNGDDAVTLADYSRMRASYGKCQGEIGYQPLADFNGDNCVTLPDYSRLRANYGVTGPLNAP